MNFQQISDRIKTPVHNFRQVSDAIGVEVHNFQQVNDALDGKEGRVSADSDTLADAIRAAKAKKR